MRTMPEWIMGGDPIRLHFLGDRQQFHPDNLVWTQIGTWGASETSLAAEIGRSRQGGARAYRIVGEVKGTARSLTGELGWRMHNDSATDIEIPFINPELWSSEWLRFCHGKIDDARLIRELCPVDAPCWITFPVGPMPNPNALTRALLLLVAGVALGIVIAFALLPENSGISKPIAHPPPSQFDTHLAPDQRAKPPDPPEPGNQPPDMTPIPADEPLSHVRPDKKVGEKFKPRTPKFDAVEPETLPNK